MTDEQKTAQHYADMDGSHSARLALMLGIPLLPWELEALHAQREMEDDGYHDHLVREHQLV